MRLPGKSAAMSLIDSDRTCRKSSGPPLSGAMTPEPRSGSYMRTVPNSVSNVSARPAINQDPPCLTVATDLELDPVAGGEAQPPYDARRYRQFAIQDLVEGMDHTAAVNGNADKTRQPPGRL